MLPVPAWQVQLQAAPAWVTVQAVFDNGIVSLPDVRSPAARALTDQLSVGSAFRTLRLTPDRPT